MIDITPGTLLISDPFLKDPNFLRTVVLLCDHQSEGSFGFVLNKRYEQSIGDLMQDLEGINFPVYYGGPVQVDSLHFLHQRPELIEGGLPLTDGIFWGGDFEQVIELLKENKLSKNDIRFFALCFSMLIRDYAFEIRKHKIRFRQTVSNLCKRVVRLSLQQFLTDRSSEIDIAEE